MQIAISVYILVVALMTASRLSFVMGVNWPNRRSPHSKTLALGYDKAPQQATSKTYFFLLSLLLLLSRHRSHSIQCRSPRPRYLLRRKMSEACVK